jgi:hypothetical protein
VKAPLASSIGSAPWAGSFNTAGLGDSGVDAVGDEAAGVTGGGGVGTGGGGDEEMTAGSTWVVWAARAGSLEPPPELAALLAQAPVPEL